MLCGLSLNIQSFLSINPEKPGYLPSRGEGGEGLESL